MNTFDYFKRNARQQSSRTLRVRQAHDIRGPRYERVISPTGDATPMPLAQVKFRVAQARTLHAAATCGYDLIADDPEKFVREATRALRATIAAAP